MTAHHIDVFHDAEHGGWQAACACGWQGSRHTSRMRAEIEASEHQFAAMAEEAEESPAEEP